MARLKRKQEEKAARDEARAEDRRRRSLERAAEADREALDQMKDRLAQGPIHARRALDGYVAVCNHGPSPSHWLICA